jgi:GntR family phosphonate transport system transcriptional regulator
MNDEYLLDRKSGIAAWRQIADRIGGAIRAGEYDGTGMLPTELHLAERFGVNRHTVRSAMAALAEEGLLRRVRGRGTMVEKRDRLVYPIGPRTRFSEGLEGQAGGTAIHLLGEETIDADTLSAAALDVAPGTELVRLETLSLADDVPVSLACHCFEAARFSGIGAAVARHRSITRALQDFGVPDYLRISTEVSARMASPAEAERLSLGPLAVVLETVAINSDTKRVPIQFSRTLFAADRIVLRLDTAGGS